MNSVHIEGPAEATHARLTRRLCWALQRKQPERAERLEARLREIEPRLSDPYLLATI